MKTLLSAENQAIYNRLAAGPASEEGAILVPPKTAVVKNPTTGVIVKSEVPVKQPPITQVAPSTTPQTIVTPPAPVVTTPNVAPSMPEPNKKPVPLVLLAGGALLLYFFFFRK